MASAARTSSKKLAASLNFLNQLVQELDELRVASADVYEFEDQCYGRILANAHDRSDLNVETKFAYLLSFTLGKTRAAIEGIPVTACESRAASSGITMQATVSRLWSNSQQELNPEETTGEIAYPPLEGRWCRKRSSASTAWKVAKIHGLVAATDVGCGRAQYEFFHESWPSKTAHLSGRGNRRNCIFTTGGAQRAHLQICRMHSVGPYERVRLVMVGGTTSSKQCLSRLLAGSVRKVWPSIVEARSESISYTAFLGEDSFYSHQPSGFSPLDDAVQLQEQWKERILVVDVLIGADYYFDFVSGRICKGKSGDSVVVKTLFGWVACGRSSLRPISAIRSLSNSHPRLLKYVQPWMRKFEEALVFDGEGSSRFASRGALVGLTCLTIRKWRSVGSWRLSVA
ncbi:hypothetical protein T4E_9589 [Trichinella pseudospiralis]|uniref:Uncharacterized protein n=1 Tax=Trichinella pseudospiralis TaxID=6337 RepID=A0A0V0Y6U5_TRIPS|nr:hypothetical protein T4E_9589 [Trichinella pseudospiralis]